MISDPAEEPQQSPDFTDFQRLENSVSKEVSEEKISLLEERLIVDFVRRKVGEIVIRKEVETCLLQVEVPVRREKLIVEQVSPDYNNSPDSFGRVVARKAIQGLKYSHTTKETVPWIAYKIF